MSNPKYLVIVESPSKGRKIQTFLGDEYIVKASMGHITDLASGGKFGIGVDIENDFKPRYVLNSDKFALIDELMADAKVVEKIYIFSDNDREGENIAWHLYQRLVDVGTPIVRGTFNEIKKDKILKAIKDAGDINMPLAKAAEARRILDRIVGFNASPFLMNVVGKGNSSGRCQSVCVRLITDNQKSIEEFIPEDFWTLQTMVKKDNDIFQVKYGSSIKDEAFANATIDKLKNTKSFNVSSVSSAEEKRFPNPPLITSTLQRVMSKDFGISAEDTMKAAQALYEGGYITYIRTDSVRASDEAISEVREFIKDKTYDVPKKPHVYKNKDSSQDAHECLRPSDLSLDPDDNFAIIDANEKRAYKLIHNFFVASQMEPAVYATLKVSFSSKEFPELEMRASGKALIKQGYLEIFGKALDGAIEIPNLSKGDEVFNNQKTSRMEKKSTQPPARFSEDKLIKELDIRGIGRPATYAQLLSKITDRNYVEKKGSVYHATDLGKKVSKILTDNFSFMNYDYSRKMEEQLDDVANGKITSLQMLQDFYPSFKKELNNAYVQSGTTMCDKCGSAMIKRTTDGKEWLGCQNYPSCRHTKQI